jgi:hypothetical protein
MPIRPIRAVQVTNLPRIIAIWKAPKGNNCGYSAGRFLAARLSVYGHIDFTHT